MKTESNSTTEEIEEVDTVSPKRICQLIDAHISGFFDRIYIPLKMFKKSRYDIDTTLCSNQDVLFYSDLYLTEKDHDRFYESYNKWIDVVSPMFDSDSKIYTFLEKWNDSDDATKMYSYNVINNTDYNMISPNYIIEYYTGLSVINGKIKRRQ